jgi:hypothetical protein
MSIRQAAGRVAVSVAAVAGVGAGSVLMFMGTASADGTAQSVTIDATDAGAVNMTPGTPFSSGQLVGVNVPANVANGGDGPLVADTNYTIWECSDPGGLAANLPQTISSCDSDTANGSSGLTGDDGSVSATGYEIYALPDTIPASSGGLGEGASHTPVCNLSNPCVLAVITNTSSFTAPTGIAFSEPFVIHPTSGDSGSGPGDGSPGTGTPEAPLAIGIPLMGAAVVGGALIRRNRKAKSLANA